MDLPLHYLHIKNMLNIALFEDLEADNKFREIKKIQISPRYIDYYNIHKSQNKYHDNLHLKINISNYLSELPLNDRGDILKIVNENIELAYAGLILQLSREDGHRGIQLDFDFQKEFDVYANSENHTPHFLVMFFMQHFLNFDHVKIENYKDYKLGRTEYFMLLSDYLQPQRKVF
jgi:hypothetical protein